MKFFFFTRITLLVRIIITSFLLLLILFNALLYYAYLNFEVITAKADAIDAISRMDNNQQAGLTKIPLINLDKDEDNEVWFQNKLYDVVKRETINDTVYVYVIRDAKEQEVLNDIHDYFKTDPCISATGVNKVSRLKNIYRIIDQTFINVQQDILLHSTNNKIHPVIQKFYHSSIDKEVLTPPPRISFI